MENKPASGKPLGGNNPHAWALWQLSMVLREIAKGEVKNDTGQSKEPPLHQVRETEAESGRRGVSHELHRLGQEPRP